MTTNFSIIWLQSGATVRLLNTTLLWSPNLTQWFTSETNVRLLQVMLNNHDVRIEISTVALPEHAKFQKNWIPVVLQRIYLAKFPDLSKSQMVHCKRTFPALFRPCLNYVTDLLKVHRSEAYIFRIIPQRICTEQQHDSQDSAALCRLVTSTIWLPVFYQTTSDCSD